MLRKKLKAMRKAQSGIALKPHPLGNRPRHIRLRSGFPWPRGQRRPRSAIPARSASCHCMHGGRRGRRRGARASTIPSRGPQAGAASFAVEDHVVECASRHAPARRGRRPPGSSSASQAMRCSAVLDPRRFARAVLVCPALVLAGEIATGFAVIRQACRRDVDRMQARKALVHGVMDW